MHSLAFAIAAGTSATLALSLPFTPSGGLDTNSTPPVYQPLSDFDYQSLNLALNQELIELDLFHNGLAKFSVQDFQNAGLSEADMYLIEFMADQESGHATMISNMLGREDCFISKPILAEPDFRSSS